MDHISSLLPKALRKRGLLEHAEASLVVTRSQQWLDEHLPQFSQDISVTTYRDRTLHITCIHSIAAQECALMQQELLEYLRSEHKDQPVESVRILRASPLEN